MSHNNSEVSQPSLKRRLTPTAKIAPANSKVLLISQPIQVKTSNNKQQQQQQTVLLQNGSNNKQQHQQQQQQQQQQIIYIGGDGRINDSFQTIQLQNGQQVM